MTSVTILLPIYNGARFLPEALESIQAQTFRDWKLLALDDGSTDETPAMLYAWAANEPRAEVLRMPHKGLVPTLNRGLALAEGSYIARMDADDRMHPQRLEQQVRAMADNPTWGVCGTAYQVIDENGAPGDTALMPEDDTQCRWQAYFHSPFAHSTVMLRRSVLEKYHLRYNPAWQLVEDFDLWVRLLKVAQGGNLRTPLLEYRLHPASVSMTGEDEQQTQANQLCQQQYLEWGVRLNPEQIRRLRGWYYRWPAVIQPEDFPVAQGLWILLLNFMRRRVWQGRMVEVRGRWLARLLLTPAPGLNRQPWRSQLRPSDLADLALYSLEKAREAL